MDNRVFNNIIENVKTGYINIHNYKQFNEFSDCLKEIFHDVEKMPAYTFDGRFETLLFQSLKNTEIGDNSYESFLNSIENALKSLIVPCLIMIPLNFFDDKFMQSNLILSEDIRIFKQDSVNQAFFSKNKELTLEKYVEKTIYKKLL